MFNDTMIEDIVGTSLLYKFTYLITDQDSLSVYVDRESPEDTRRVYTDFKYRGMNSVRLVPNDGSHFTLINKVKVLQRVC